METNPPKETPTAGSNQTAGASNTQKRTVPIVTHVADTGKTMDTLTLTTTTTEARVDSRLLAKHLHIQHESMIKSVKDYRADFEKLGLIRFQTGEIDGRGRPEKFVMLNEDQSFLALTYSRNTARVRGLKVRLVKAFGEARRAADMRRTDYLPSFHQLQDAIHAVSETASNERNIHTNIAKLVNKTVGLASGQRTFAPIPQQAMLIVAQTMATQAMQGADNHLDGYQRAKAALLALTACTTLGTTGDFTAGQP